MTHALVTVWEQGQEQAGPYLARVAIGPGPFCRHRSFAQHAADLPVFIRQRRAGDVIASTWEHDGHPDHEACARASLRIAEKCGLTVLQAPIWAWHWRRPDSGVVPWSRARRFAIAADVALLKVRALSAFHSEVRPYGGEPPVVDASALAHFKRGFEIFLV